MDCQEIITRRAINWAVIPSPPPSIRCVLSLASFVAALEISRNRNRLAESTNRFSIISQSRKQRTFDARASMLC